MTKKVGFLSLLVFINLFASEKFATIQQSCKSGNLSSCIDLGVIYFTAEGVEEDLKKSEILFKRACKGRIAKGCYYLGYIYKRGGKGVAKDKLKAKLAFGRACNIGSERSCVQFRSLETKGI